MDSQKDVSIVDIQSDIVQVEQCQIFRICLAAEGDSDFFSSIITKIEPRLAPPELLVRVGQRFTGRLSPIYWNWGQVRMPLR